MLEKYWREDAIQSAPVYALAECAAFQTNIFDEDDLADAPVLCAGIKERFRTALLVCDEPQLDFLRCAINISADKMPLDDMPQGGFYSFYRNGFAYLFAVEDKDYLVVPDELAEIYNQTLSSPDFAEKSKRNQELCQYANALLNLYGAYEISWLVTVWNQHKREKTTVDEAQQVLSDLTCFHSDFYFNEDWVVHDCLFDDDFEYLCEEVEDIDYYMPTKSVIMAYADSEHYEKAPGAKEMNDFLANFITHEVKLENLQLEIALSCERLESPEYVKYLLEQAEFPLDDADTLTKFEQLYQNYRDNLHIWELRGFIPHQWERETGKRLKRFALPAAKKKKEKKKKHSTN